MSKQSNYNIVKKMIRSRKQSGIYKSVDVTLSRYEKQQVTLFTIGAFIPLFIGLILFVIQ